MLRLLADARRAKKGGEQAMAARQRARLAGLVAWARTRSPYYRHLYRDLPAGLADLTRLPVTRKSELMAAFDDWVTDPTVTFTAARAFADDPAVKLDIFQSRSEGPQADRDIAGRAWDLPELNRAYAEFLERYRPRLPRYRAGELQGAEALVERMRYPTVP